MKSGARRKGRGEEKGRKSRNTVDLLDKSTSAASDVAGGPEVVVDVGAGAVRLACGEKEKSKNMSAKLDKECLCSIDSAGPCSADPAKCGQPIGGCICMQIIARNKVLIGGNLTKRVNEYD